MEGHVLPARDATDVGHLVRALGGHRYVAGRLILIHAAAFQCVAGDVLSDAQAWAASVLADREIDASSRDERLWRRSTEKELAAVLEGFWGAGGEAARANLTAWLEAVELPVGEGAPFDEDGEDDIHPVLVDAGWELLPLAALDPERHRGAIDAFGDAISYEAARFDEENAVPIQVHLAELPALGPVEILRGVSASGLLTSELVLWTEGNATYHDYVLRGVLRAAKLA
jgi:hypothetical protein